LSLIEALSCHNSPHLVRWNGIWNGPPGSLTAKEKWEPPDDIHGAMTQRYDDAVFRTALVQLPG
jgi:hypothetical protein